MSIIRSFFLVLLLITSAMLYGQEDNWSAARIAEMEGVRFRSDKFSSPKSFNGANYDWKYAECYWQIDPAVKYITGRVKNTIEILNLTDTILFDLSDALTVNSVMIEGQNVDFLFKDPLTLAIVFAEPRQSGEVIIEINYEGIPQANSYLSFTQSFHGMAPEIYTLSEPYGARDWWPCKQSLKDKVDSIFIEITVPNGQKAGSNGKLLYESANANGSVSFGWKHRYPIPAYLVSLAVTNYAEFSQTVVFEDVEIHVLNYVYPEKLEKEQERSETLPDLIILFSDLFGIYPYADEKYGNCQTSIPGGMEHTTMSTMSNLNFSLSAHELAHQWFGDKVTCGSWEDIWLNESFATYLTGLSYEHLTTAEDWIGWKTGLQNSVKSKPDGSVFVNDTTSRDRIFDGRLSYNKGAYVLHMLRWIMGDADFFLACRNYLNDPDLAFGFAYTPDLIAHFEVVYGNDLTEFFNDWYYGQGFPTYSLIWSPAQAGIAFSLEQTTSHSSVGFYQLPVPVQFIGDERDTVITFHHNYSGEQFYVQPGFDVKQIHIDPDLWILANKQVIYEPDSDIDISAISFQPNPVSTLLWVALRNPSFVAEKYSIINSAGKVIRSVSPSGGIRTSFQVDVSTLAAGVYILRLSNGSSTKTGSFVVAKP